ncbi:hypothetical protein V5O48_006259 [Marasmius crinis-equi]|uniref:SET domain-containing protein n=1 Tax=Marasmius crinis-equi TaxID=585013 RepID=A0ABR3FK08_9AGAR
MSSRQPVPSPLPTWESIREPTASSRASSDDERPSVRMLSSQGRTTRPTASGSRGDGGSKGSKRRLDGKEDSGPITKKSKSGGSEDVYQATRRNTNANNEAKERPRLPPTNLPATSSSASAATSNPPRQRAPMRKPANGNYPSRPPPPSQKGAKSATSQSASAALPHRPSGSNPHRDSGTRADSPISLSSSETEVQVTAGAGAGDKRAKASSKVSTSRKGKEKSLDDFGMDDGDDDDDDDDVVRTSFSEQERRRGGQSQSSRKESKARKLASSARGSGSRSASAMSGAETISTKPTKRFKSEKDRRKSGDYNPSQDARRNLGMDNRREASSTVPQKHKFGIRATTKPRSATEVIELLLSSDEEGQQTQTVPEPEIIEIIDDDEPPKQPQPTKPPKSHRPKNAPKPQKPSEIIVISDNEEPDDPPPQSGGEHATKLLRPAPSFSRSGVAGEGTSASQDASLHETETDIGMGMGADDGEGGMMNHNSPADIEMAPDSSSSTPPTQAAVVTMPGVEAGSPVQRGPSPSVKVKQQSTSPAKVVPCRVPPPQSDALPGTSPRLKKEPPFSSSKVPSPPKTAPSQSLPPQSPISRTSPASQPLSSPLRAGGGSTTLAVDESMPADHPSSPSSAPEPPPSSPSPSQVTSNTPPSRQTPVPAPNSVSKACSMPNPTSQSISDAGSDASRGSVESPPKARSSSEQRRSISQRGRANKLVLAKWAEKEEQEESQRRATESSHSSGPRIKHVARKTTGGRPPRKVDTSSGKPSPRSSTGGPTPHKRAPSPSESESSSSSPSPSPTQLKKASDSYVTSMAKAFDEAGRANAPNRKGKGKAKESSRGEEHTSRVASPVGNDPHPTAKAVPSMDLSTISPHSSRKKTTAIAQMENIIITQPPLNQAPSAPSGDARDLSQSPSDDFSQEISASAKQKWLEMTGRGGGGSGLPNMQNGGHAKTSDPTAGGPPAASRSPDFDLTQIPSSDDEMGPEDYQKVEEEQRELQERFAKAIAEKARGMMSTSQVSQGPPLLAEQLSSEVAVASNVNDSAAGAIPQTEESDELEYLDEPDPRTSDDVMRERASLEELMYPESPENGAESMLIDDAPDEPSRQETAKIALTTTVRSSTEPPPPSPTPSSDAPQVPVTEEELTGRPPRSSSASSSSATTRVVLRRSTRTSRMAARRRSSTADTDILNLSSTKQEVAPKPVSYGGLPVLTWDSFRDDPNNFKFKVYWADDMPHAVQDHINYIDAAVRNNPDTRHVLESIIVENTCHDEPQAPMIRIEENKIPGDPESTPQWEFIYSNKMWNARDVPEPTMKNLGSCNCIGKCDPETCACVKRQRERTKKFQQGFVYDDQECLRQAGLPVLECNSLCRCDDNCMNRVVQRGRKIDVTIFKTKYKGWGVKNGSKKKKIRTGQFIGVYSGEYLTQEEAEDRGKRYNKFGRTYLFDCNLFYMKNRGDEDDGCRYTIDAYHAGNFTRFFNHSCDPNAVLAYVYIDEGDLYKPLLCFFARRDIEAGEEITFSYGGDPDNVDTDEETTNGQRKKKTKGSRSKKLTNRDTVYEECRCGAENCIGILFC